MVFIKGQSSTFKGRKHSLLTKKRMSLAHKGKPNKGTFRKGMISWNKGVTGKNSHRYGRKFSEEERINISRGQLKNRWRPFKILTCCCCRKQFKQTRRSYIEKYCSRECYLKGTKKVKVCVVCGKEFYGKSSIVVCCSKECGYKLASEKRKKGTMLDCEWCGKKTYRMLSRIKNHVFCSKECCNNFLGSDKNKSMSKGWHHTEKAHEKIRQAGMGRPISKEGKERLRKANLGKTYTKETLEKMRQSHLGKKHTKEEIQKIRANAKYGKENYSWKGGRPKCIDCSKQLVVYTAKRCPSCARKIQFASKRPTLIESILYEFLESNHLVFDKQKLIGDKFLVDVYIPRLNLIIEADGDYWHNLDRVKQKDKSENAYLLKCGYNLIRLKESDILNGEYKKRLLKYL